MLGQLHLSLEVNEHFMLEHTRSPPTQRGYYFKWLLLNKVINLLAIATHEREKKRERERKREREGGRERAITHEKFPGQAETQIQDLLDGSWIFFSH